VGGSRSIYETAFETNNRKCFSNYDGD